MATQPQRPGETEEIDEELRRILDQHINAADKDSERVSREELLRNGLRKFKPQVPR